MRIRHLIFPLVLGLVLAAPSQAQQDAVAEGKAVLDMLLASFNARDFATYERLVAEDVEVYTGVYTPLRFVGKPQWLAFLRGLDSYASASYDQRNASCRAYNNDTVLCNAYFVFSTTTQTGVTEVQSGRESTTLVRLGGRWLLANHHFSAMF